MFESLRRWQADRPGMSRHRTEPEYLTRSMWSVDRHLFSVVAVAFTTRFSNDEATVSLPVVSWMTLGFAEPAIYVPLLSMIFSIEAVEKMALRWSVVKAKPL